MLNKFSKVWTVEKRMFPYIISDIIVSFDLAHKVRWRWLLSWILQKGCNFLTVWAISTNFDSWLWQIWRSDKTKLSSAGFIMSKECYCCWIIGNTFHQIWQLRMWLIVNTSIECILLLALSNFVLFCTCHFLKWTYNTVWPFSFFT